MGLPRVWLSSKWEGRHWFTEEKREDREKKDSHSLKLRFVQNLIGRNVVALAASIHESDTEVEMGVCKLSKQ